MAAYQACLTRPPDKRIAADIAAAKDLAVTGTPTFFVGVVQQDGRVLVKRRLSGAQPPEQFRATIEEVERASTDDRVRQSVTISTATASATVRYTTDGSEPTESSTVASGTIAVNASQTLKAKAFRGGMCPESCGKSKMA